MPEALAQSVSAGSSHTTFVKTDGTLWVTGLNDYGQLGDGTTTSRVAPVQVASGVASVAAGYKHTMFVKKDRTLWAMGRNSSGQFGTGFITTAPQKTPTQVASDVASVAAGSDNTMFVKTDATLWTVGSNSSGQLGGGGTGIGGYRSTPVQVASGVGSVAASGNHTLFLKLDGTLWGMGYNGYGELGDGTTTNRNAPVLMASGVTSFSAGGAHSVFVKTDGTMWVVGDNEFGQLGNGATTTVPRTTPIQVASDVASVAAGGSYTMFVKTDGTLWAVGSNVWGQLGDGTMLNRNSPVQVTSGVASVAAGDGHAVFIKTDGRILTTGYNLYGQLGDGTTTNRSTPLQVGALILPTVTTQPQSQLVPVRATVSFNVVATSPAPFTFQWKKDSVVIVGATSGTFSIASAVVPDAGSYIVLVTNAAGTVTSNSAILAVNVPPAITTQPVSAGIGIGTSVVVSIVATGTAPLIYQWSKNGSALAGATSSSLAIADSASSAAGVYRVSVSNLVGTVVSNPATLTILDAQATHAVVAAGYVSGGSVTIASTLNYSGVTSGLGWQMLLPLGWTYASGTGDEGDVKPTAGTPEILEWGWTTIPPNPITFTTTLNVPAGTTGDKSIAALAIVRQSGIVAKILVKPDPLVVPQVIKHSADTDRNFRISLIELTRVIELYNTRIGTSRTGRYLIQESSEDGYGLDTTTPGGALTTMTRFHSADSNRNAQINLFELTRVIELYNVRDGSTRTGAYRVLADTEDGFAPGP